MRLACQKAAICFFSAAVCSLALVKGGNAEWLVGEELSADMIGLDSVVLGTEPGPHMLNK